ncbi:mitochondrial carrier domain-containing protein [Suillus clintonianus]|uniref:mitochondrial carrier domain-containing protein n=1 Tax=Suillus clintonianus TaxID=1904413 RepID=UPI001B882564|nr:mitochondrial carrier domain-containing protein [Suillus clintonianus]KAG2122345.1 mitochondrial carrier domain-containing protein [Suillus clintonianus]
MTSVLPPFVQAASGSLGSASANTLTYPLDLITTRIQATEKGTSIRKQIHTHGLSSFYDGIGADAGATLISSFLYYYIYSFLREYVVRGNGKSRAAMLSLPQELAIGYLSGIASRSITTPLNLVTVRLQTARVNDDSSAQGGTSRFTAICQQIFEEEGLRGFWKGFSSTFLLSLNPAVTLYLFQQYRRVMLKGKERASPPPAHSFVGGALANSIAVIILYPLLLAKTVVQASRRTRSTNNTSQASIQSSLQAIYTTGGFFALYRGLGAQLFKGVLRQGTAMMVKQRIEQLVVQAYLRQRALRRVQYKG